MKDLQYYLPEIWSIAKANNVPVGTGMDMFVNNLKLKTNKYHGANVDYQALGEEWNTYSISTQSSKKTACSRLMTAKYNKLVELFKAGKLSEMRL